MGWRKVGTVPAKADPDEQAKYLQDKLLPRLKAAQRGQRTVLFVDAAHFVFGPFLGYLWCLVRLFIPGPCGRKRYNVLAALDAMSHQVIRVSNHAYINAESVWQLLRQIAAAGLCGQSPWCWTMRAISVAWRCRHWRDPSGSSCCSCPATPPT